MKKQLILKLIESSDSPKIGSLVKDFNGDLGICLQSDIPNSFNVQYNDGIYHRYYKPFGDKHKGLLIDKLIKPIAISDEEIKVGDYGWDKRDNLIYSLSNSDEEDTKLLKDNSKKIELLPEHFSNDILQLIVDGILKDGDTIEVAIDTYNNQIMFDERGCASISIPESNTKEVSKILYSEESILNIIDEVEEELMKEVEGDFEYNGVSHYIELLKERLKK